MKTVEKIFEPYQKGHSAMILNGRPITDFDCDAHGRIIRIVKMTAELAYSKYGMVMFRYSLMNGISVKDDIYPQEDRDTIKRVRNEIMGNIGANGSASQEFVNVLRGLLRVSTSKEDVMWRNERWNEKRMRFLFLFEFSSHLIPPDNNTTNYQIAQELIYAIAHSQGFRERRHLFILSDVVDDRIDDQVRDTLYNLFLPYPDYDEKLTFVGALHKKYPQASYSCDVTDNVIANLSSCTPNESLDYAFDASQEWGRPIDVRILNNQKEQDVQKMSEETIMLLNTDRVKGVTLQGSNVLVPMNFLNTQANGLRNRDGVVTHTNLLLMGAPGTGKTDLALLTAKKAGLPIYQLMSPKAGIVGETERKANLQANIIANITPGLFFIDEITEVIPAQRNANQDSGATDAVMAAMLNILSDNGRAGKSLFIGTSNCGFKLCAAMRDRFTIVPVLMASKVDLPAIICSIANRISGLTFNEEDPYIWAAADIFYQKHLYPRRIHSTLKFACSQNKLTPQAILAAAQKATPLDNVSWLSAVYADLCAISLTVTEELLPWYGHEDNYPFPDYIAEILDESHQIDSVKLNKRIQELEPYVNV